MSQWDLQANETSVYFKNYVNDEVVEAVQKKLWKVTIWSTYHSV